MKQTWLYRWDVKSSTTSDKYTVSMKANGTWGCSCKRWIFAKAPKLDCKHITKVKTTEALAQVLIDATASVTEHIHRAQQVTTRAQQQNVEQEPYFVTQTTRSIILED